MDILISMLYSFFMLFKIFLTIGLETLAVYIICNNMLQKVMKRVDWIESLQILASITLFQRISEIVEAVLK